MKYKLLVTLFVICLSISFSACGNDENKIFINGNIKESVEVYSNYIDKGVTYPAEYTLVTDGVVDTSILGVQKIKYSVFSADGALKKELYRFVKVVDTEAPTYVQVENDGYYVGINYTIDDFLAEYKDNYDQKSDLQITSNDLTFTDTGMHVVRISISDSSKNTATYTKDINVVLDVQKLLLHIYKGQTYKITSRTTENGSSYTNVQIDSTASFTCFDTDSLHYIKTVSTNLGWDATIQISAKYGEFSKANISHNISNGISSYSVGFATIDATKQSVIVNKFDSTINNLNLDTEEMLTELNKNINTVLVGFQKYMNETLHLTVK